MGRIILFAALSSLAGAAFGQQPDASPKVRHLIGLENIKHNAGGKLSVQSGTLEFSGGNKTDAKVPLSSIQDIFVGTETTQGGGTVGRVVKTASIAAPYHSGSVLTLLLRTKVDMLTVQYRDAGGALHAAIFALPKGQAEQLRSLMVAGGAHASAPNEQVAEKELKERKSQ